MVVVTRSRSKWFGVNSNQSFPSSKSCVNCHKKCALSIDTCCWCSDKRVSFSDSHLLGNGQVLTGRSWGYCKYCRQGRKN